jgi:hypothetical protein
MAVVLTYGSRPEVASHLDYQIQVDARRAGVGCRTMMVGDKRIAIQDIDPAKSHQNARIARFNGAFAEDMASYLFLPLQGVLEAACWW